MYINIIELDKSLFSPSSMYMDLTERLYLAITLHAFECLCIYLSMHYNNVYNREITILALSVYHDYLAFSGGGGVNRRG